ncbi:MAG: NAD(P)H-binding protein [Gemmatimonadaceae bacterium]|nr:NAD(P)H-binding protein [Gloeobacterales cyanobacterium ES-bin-141]
MTDTNSTILAVGAAGKFASLVVPELAKRGAKVRGLVRDAKQGEEVRKHGAAEVAVGDLRNRASLDAALKGVDSVFYIAPAFIPAEAGRATRSLIFTSCDRVANFSKLYLMQRSR